jgi:hypothetical protein
MNRTILVLKQRRMVAKLLRSGLLHHGDHDWNTHPQLIKHYY